MLLLIYQILIYILLYELLDDANHVCGYCNCSSSSASVDQGNEKRISPFSEYPPQHSKSTFITSITFYRYKLNQLYTYFNEFNLKSKLLV